MIDLAIVGDLVANGRDLLESASSFIELIVVCDDVSNIAENVNELASKLRARSLRFGVVCVTLKTHLNSTTY